MSMADFHLNAEFAEPMKMYTWCQVNSNCCILRIRHSVTDNIYVITLCVCVSMWRPKSSTRHIWRKIQHQMTCVPLMDRFLSIVLRLHTPNGNTHFVLNGTMAYPTIIIIWLNERCLLCWLQHFLHKWFHSLAHSLFLALYCSISQAENF